VQNRVVQFPEVTTHSPSLGGTCASLTYIYTNECTPLVPTGHLQGLPIFLPLDKCAFFDGQAPVFGQVATINGIWENNTSSSFRSYVGSFTAVDRVENLSAVSHLCTLNTISLVIEPGFLCWMSFTKKEVKIGGLPFSMPNGCFPTMVYSIDQVTLLRELVVLFIDDNGELKFKLIYISEDHLRKKLENGLIFRVSENLLILLLQTVFHTITVSFCIFSGSTRAISNKSEGNTIRISFKRNGNGS